MRFSTCWCRPTRDFSPPRHDQGRHGADRRGPRRRRSIATWARRREISGGSAANTIVGIASLGARAAYVGKVKDDQIGRLYSHDIRAAGVAFETKPASGGPATGCSYILVTPDGERTMNTYLGAAQELTPADIDAGADRGVAKIVYLEGYLWDPKSAKEAFVKASTIAHEAGRQVALTLSDAFCVDRYRDEIPRSDAQGHGRPDLRQ